MIEIAAYFEQGNMGAAVDNLLELPEAIRPIYFSENEELSNTGDRLVDSQRFEEFKRDNSFGFFLFGEKSLFDVTISPKGYSHIYLELPEESPEYIRSFFEIIAHSDPVFGYAADPGERDHRNRIYRTIGVNNIESWVGRDVSNYVPGLYCYTLLSDELIIKHGVDLSTLTPLTLSVDELSGGRLHLLQFFMNTTDWQAEAQVLDDLCYRIHGVFSIREVNEAVEGQDSYLEYSDVISNWR